MIVTQVREVLVGPRIDVLVEREEKRERGRGVIRETPVSDVPMVPTVPPLRSVQGLRLFKVQGSKPYGGSRFNSSRVQRKINQKGELPRFGNSRNVEMRNARLCRSVGIFP